MRRANRSRTSRMSSMVPGGASALRRVCPVVRSGRRLATWVVVAVAVVSAAWAEEPLRTAGDRPVDIKHLKLTLDVSIEKRQIAGIATLELVTLRPLSTIRLEAIDHQVRRVTGTIADGKAVELEFENTGNRWVTLWFL